MKWTEIKVIFDAADREFAADLIADIFYDLGLSGVVLEDPDMPLSVTGAADPLPPRVSAVSAYLPKTEKLVDSVGFIKERLQLLDRDFHIHNRIVYREIDEIDWAESWKAFFWPQRIGRKIVVKPSWREYASTPDDVIVEIDPGMAFGTGTHPTTSLSLEMIETYLQKGAAFLDVGTGSGILLVAAIRLGAGKATGIDNDPIALEIAEKNLRLNNVGPEKFKLQTGDLTEAVRESFDFIAANILTGEILRLLDHIPDILVKGGVFVCSGIIAENKSKVLSKLEKLGFIILDTALRDQWVAIASRLPLKQSP